MVETLTGLVSRYSPSGAEGEAVAWLVARMQALGFTRSQIDPAGNAVGVMGAGPNQVVLLGHIDTVPGEIPVRVEAGSLYGRGSVDAKGPLAAFVDAVARLGTVEGWQWVVVGAVDEERDSQGARYVVEQYRPHFVLVGEPSGWERLTLGYKGSAAAELQVRLPASHGASGNQTACEAAFALWQQVSAWAGDFNASRARVFDQATVSLKNFSAGETGFENWASLRIGARLPVDLPPAAWYAQLQSLCETAAVQPLGYAIPAYVGGKNNPLVRGMLAGIRAQGGQPGFLLKSGTADLNIVAPAWACPALAYGPGDSALDHTPDEHLSLVEYAQAVEVLATALQRLAGK